MIKVVVLSGTDSIAQNKRLREHVKKRKLFIQSQGGKSAEGFTIRKEKAVSLSE